mmetsp:Transcript_23605/g.36974  ORF Transcript_23605/g.36974 Transcript_23605/m.36974 type:complete len:263 (+) Transcript_23605:139-927(+)
MPQYAPITIITILTTILLLLIITFKSPELIGFTYGPSSQLLAIQQQQLVQSNLLSSHILSSSDNQTTAAVGAAATSWMTRIQTTAQQIYNPQYELAYNQQNCNITCIILRDAGVFAAMVGVLRACNFFGTAVMSSSTTIAIANDGVTTMKQQQQQQRRLYQLFMAVALFILPGMIGQIFISKTIPIETVILWNHRSDTTDTNDVTLSGILEGILYVGYCTLKSVLLGQDEGGGDAVLAVGSSSVMYELKVVGVALAFVALVL